MHIKAALLKPIVKEMKAINIAQKCRPVKIKDMQTLPLRSGHFDIKDAQYAENKDGRKNSFHIISRLGAVGVQKGRYGRPKLQISSKMTKFAGKIRIDLTLIFPMNEFFRAILSF